MVKMGKYFPTSPIKKSNFEIFLNFLMIFTSVLFIAEVPQYYHLYQYYAAVVTWGLFDMVILARCNPSISLWNVGSQWDAWDCYWIMKEKEEEAPRGNHLGIDYYYYY